MSIPHPRPAETRARLVERLALRVVPPDWRECVARDLTEEAGGEIEAWRWRTFETLRIGVRLRTARLRNRQDGIGLARSADRSLSMSDMLRDLRLAVRTALRRPAYSVAVVATLAIGIGATTAIFSLFNWILFRPLPGVDRPEELATIRYQRQDRSGQFFVSYRDYADIRDGATATLVGVAASGPRTMDLAVGEQMERIGAEVVTVNYFSLLGVRPTAGRNFDPAEEHPGGGTPVIISTRLAGRLFGSNEGALGRTVRLNGRSFTIVGVAPSRFQGRSPVTVTDAWLTISGHAALLPPGSEPGTLLTSRQQTMFGDAFARMRPGVTLENAQAEALAVAQNVPGFASTFSAPGTRSGIEPILYPGIGHETYTQERLELVFKLLMGAVGLLLLLACANAANLLLARAASRRREVAVCQAIGASRFRVVRQELAGALVLSLAAGGAGLALAVWFTSLFDGMRIVSMLPPVSGVSVDWRVCGFALAVSVLTGLLFSTAPAIAGSRVDLQTSLKDGTSATTSRRRLLRGLLVTVQIAVSVLLLVAAGLFLRTLANIRGIDLGIQPDGIVQLAVQPGRYGLTTERSVAYLRELLEQLRAAPGITSAAFTWTTPFSPNRSDLMYSRIDARQQTQSAAQTAVSPGFFATMGIPLVAGRDFTEAETRKTDGSGVIIISRAAADAVFPDGGAVGAQLVLSYPKGKIVEVVGIVGDVRGRAVTREPEPWVYTPAVAPSWGMIQVRSPLPEAQVVATVREVARRIDPIVTPHEIEAFGSAVDRALSEQRLFARASVVFAAVAAALAGIGIYSMMAGAVAERRKEFGIRLALGARGPAVMSLVLRSSVALASLGVVAGLAGAVAVRALIEARLYGVTALDPVSMSGAAAAVLLLAILAALVPALRAASVDPVRSLRVE